MPAMSFNFALVQKKTKASQPVKIKARIINMSVILHKNDISNDS